MPAYAEGGVSAHLIAAATDNNRQRLRTRRAKPSRNQPVLALVFASAAARARAQGRFHESRRRRRLPERRAVRQGAARARRPRHPGESATESAWACRSSRRTRHSQ